MRSFKKCQLKEGIGFRQMGVSVDLDFEKETNTGCLLTSLALFKGEKREWQQQINPIPEKRGVSFSDPFEITKL